MRSVDWKRFCGDHGVRTSGVLRDGMWLECRCPFCDDTGTHGAINIRSNAYTCWRCGTHRMGEFVSATAGVSGDWRDIGNYLAPYSMDGVDYTHVDREKRETRLRIERTVRDTGLKLPTDYRLGNAMKRYLLHRGFNPDYLEEHYGLRDGGIGGDWAYRLLIPVYVGGKIVAWQGRHIGDSKIRYRASSLKESMNVKDTVYNLDNCHRDSVIAVEGVFDAWRLGDDCVAMFGISVRDAQLALLAKKFKHVYFLFDPEPTATENARECARKLQHLGCKATVLKMGASEAGDPAELSAEEVVQVKRFVFGEDYRVDPVWIV